MSQNVLFKYYPQWLLNCRESISWLQSADYDKFCKDHKIEPKTLDQRQAAIKEYEEKIRYYEKALSK